MSSRSLTNLPFALALYAAHKAGPVKAETPILEIGPRRPVSKCGLSPSIHAVSMTFRLGFFLSGSQLLLPLPCPSEGIEGRMGSLRGNLGTLVPPQTPPPSFNPLRGRGKGKKKLGTRKEEAESKGHRNGVDRWRQPGFRNWPPRPDFQNGRLRFDRTSLVCGVERQREWEVGQVPRRQRLTTLTRFTSWELLITNYE